MRETVLNHPRAVRPRLLPMLPPLLLLLAVTPVRGQEGRIKIEHLERLADKAAEVVDVSLDGKMLQLAAKFMSDERSPDEAAARELIKKLKGVYVKSFEFDKEGEYTQADIQAVRNQLHAPEWSRIVQARSKREGENAEVYIMGSESDVKGMTIIAAEPKELTVVNIVGPIDVDRLSDLEGRFGVPHLGIKSTDQATKEATGHAKAR